MGIAAQKGRGKTGRGKENPGALPLQGLENRLKDSLALAELGSPTGSLQAVLLTFLHTRIAGEEASLLQHGTQVLRIVLEQGAGHAVADGAGLSGNAAAGHAADDVKLLVGAGEGQGLTDDIFQGVQAKVIIDIAVVDGDLAGALVQACLLYTSPSPRD